MIKIFNSAEESVNWCKNNIKYVLCYGPSYQNIFHNFNTEKAITDYICEFHKGMINRGDGTIISK